MLISVFAQFIVGNMEQVRFASVLKQLLKDEEYDRRKGNGQAKKRSGI